MKLIRLFNIVNIAFLLNFAQATMAATSIAATTNTTTTLNPTIVDCRDAISSINFHLEAFHSSDYQILGTLTIFDSARNVPPNTNRHTMPFEEELKINVDSRIEFQEGNKAEIKRLVGESGVGIVHDLFIAVYFYYTHGNTMVTPDILKTQLWGHTIMEKVTELYNKNYRWPKVDPKDWKLNVNAYDALHRVTVGDIATYYQSQIAHAHVDLNEKSGVMQVNLTNGHIIRIYNGELRPGLYDQEISQQREFVKTKYQENGYFDDPTAAFFLDEDLRIIQETGAGVEISVWRSK